MKEIVDLLSSCKAKGIRFTFDYTTNILKLNGDLNSLSESEKSSIRKYKEEIISVLNTANKPVVNGINKVEVQDHYVLSSSQHWLWILSQYSAGNRAYNIPGVYVFEGTVDRSALAYSFRSLIERHEILRTVFREDATGEVRQYILPESSLKFDLSYEDLRESPDADQHLSLVVSSAFLLPFDLSSGPLLRASLYRIGNSRWVFTFTMHHIISDGWSMGVLIRELLQLYNARIKGEENPLKPLRIQYKDYAVWQHKQLGEPGIGIHRD